MKTIVLLSFSIVYLFLLLPVRAQEKGILPVSQTENPSPDSFDSYAVVIGISDYLDEKIPDLRFADRDAEAFATFLKTEAGGSLDNEHLKLLTNENATTGKIVAAMDWLIENAKKDDQVIIYFSGHGDVEQKTAFQLGFLLTHDSPGEAYAAGAFHLYYLQAIISTLSTENKAKVIVISDACRAGKLAGNKIGGSHLTSANLAKQFSNELKILSCQPDEFSMEGEQWGGGRGAFSFHLINGLYGLADYNNDNKINLLEIGRYVQDNVSTEVAPHEQFPVTVGNNKANLFHVIPKFLLQIEEKNLNEPPLISTVEIKGMEEELLVNVDTNIQKIYDDYLKAIEEKYFLPTDIKKANDGMSASELFDILIEEKELAPLHNLMRRNFAAALQEQSQQAIIAYLKADTEEMDKRYDHFGDDYRKNTQYLSKALELLGSSHYLHNHLLAQRYYFAGLIYRLDGENYLKPVLFDSAQMLVAKALQYDRQSPYIFNEMGMIKKRQRKFKEALLYFDSASVTAPTWILPPMNKLITHRILREHHAVDSLGKLIINMDPDHNSIYYQLAYDYEVQNKKEEAKKMYLKSIKLKPDDLGSRNNIGHLYLTEGKKELAKKYFLECLEIDSNYFYGLQSMAIYHRDLSQHDSAIFYYRKAIESRPAELLPYLWLAYELMYINQFAGAKENLEKLNKLSPAHIEYLFGMACWHSLQGNKKEGILFLKKALQSGIKKSRVMSDADLDNLRGAEEFDRLMKEYFTDK